MQGDESEVYKVDSKQMKQVTRASQSQSLKLLIVMSLHEDKSKVYKVDKKRVIRVPPKATHSSCWL